MAKQKILIVGGTGFIGYHLAKKCLSLGWDVTSISKKRPIEIRALKIKYLYCDLFNKLRLNKILKNLEFDYVVNLGGYVDHSKSKKTYNSHYVGCKNLVSAIQKKKLIKRFIQMGSSLEYGNKNSPHDENMTVNPKNSKSIYSKSKILATDFLLKKYREENFPVIIFRLYLTYGPRQDLNRLIPIVINHCLKDVKFPTSNGDQLRDFIYIEDVVRILLRSIKKKNINGQIFNLGSGKATSVKKIISTIVQIVNKGKPNYGEIKLRSDEQNKTYPDIKKLKKNFSIYKFVDFSEGLKKTIKYYKKNVR
ncbi:NAD-dependent epimerase/dehydratase family protein [Candidatus Pelagibacter sp.]|nr:NAD-dependent epimerase/dehydratase family protein [Candidatus Pelagibacter sp.]